MLDLIFSGLASIVGDALDGLIRIFMPLLDFNFDTFNSAFPYAADAYPLIQSIAIAVVLLIATIQVVPFFFGGKRQNETPIRILLSAAIAVAAIFYGNYIFTAIMDFAQLPFDALRVSHTSASWGWNLSSIISSATYHVSILLYIVLIVAMGIAFLKLMLEIIERYVFLFVLIYLSPLASSTLASRETSGVFWKFVSMFISQCALFVLNIWFLKMVVSMFQNLASSPFLLLGLLMGYAMLRIAAKIDSYMNQLGLNAAAVGMGNELFAAGMMLMSMGGKAVGKGSTGAEGRGGVLGVADKVAQGYGKISPVAGVSQGISHGIGGLWKSGKQAVGATIDAAKGGDSFLHRVANGIEAGSKTFGGSLSPNMHDAWMKTQGGSLWARGYAGMRGNQPGWDDISKNGFVADNAIRYFENAQGNCSSECSEDIAALCQGIGLDRVDENAQEMFDVGYGNVAAENLAYKIDENGIQAQYEKDGWQHDWQVKTASQYAKLSPQEQQSYTAFQSSDGKQYYMSYNKSRAESAATKSQTAAMEQIQNFGLNPLQHQLDSNAMAMLRKDPAMVHDLYRDLYNNDVSFDTSTAEGRRAMADLLSITPVASNAYADKKAAMDALAGDGTITSSSFSAAGMSLKWNDKNGQPHTYRVNAPSKNGREGWSSHTPPPTPREIMESNIANFSATPVQVALSSDAKTNLARNPEAVHGIYRGFGSNNISFDASTAEGRRAMADMLSITPVSGSAFAGKKAAMDALAGGATIVASSCNANGMDLKWNDINGNTYDFSVKTPAGTTDAAALMNNGYTSFDMGSGSYGWAHYTAPTTQWQQKGAELDSAIQRFTTNPLASPLSGSQIKQICRDDNAMTTMMQGLSQSGKTLHYEKNPQTPTQKATNEVLADFATNMRFAGISSRDANAAAMAIRSGTANYAELNGTGFTCNYNATSNEAKRITVLTADHAKVDSNNADKMQALENQNYQGTTVGNATWYAHTQNGLPANDNNKATDDFYS